MITDEDLISGAARARQCAYAPYSHFPVGAAVLAGSGKVYTGVNVDNASFGLTICAERSAVFSAVAAGEREIQAVAVVTSIGAAPCGACRQVLSEFAPKPGGLRAVRVIMADSSGVSQACTLDELLPRAFNPSDLPG